MKTSEAGLAEIRKSEAYREFAYPDVASALYKTYPKAGWGFKPARVILASMPDSAVQLSGAPWTVGYGQTKGVTIDSQLTPAAAEINLRETIRPYELAVEKACTVKPTQGQFDALVSIAWNVMSAVNPKTSSIIKAHNRCDWQAASRAFGLYNKAKGKVDKGLTLRRAREGAAYLAASPSTDTGVEESENFVEQPPPQEVDAERSMVKSQINIASTAAGGATAVAAVSETVNSVAAVKAGVASLSDWAVPILLIAVVCLCGYIIWQRVGQRKSGWA